MESHATPSSVSNTPVALTGGVSSTAAIQLNTEKKANLAEVKSSEIKHRLTAVIQVRSNPAALPLIKEYLTRMAECKVEAEQRIYITDCYRFMDDLVKAGMRESLQMMLTQLPGYGVYNALSYVYHAFPVSADEKGEREDLVKRLITQGAAPSVHFHIMEMGEAGAFTKVAPNDAKDAKAGDLVAAQKTRPDLPSVIQLLNAESFAGIMKDLLTDMLGNRSKYPFSNPEQALNRLLKAGIKPTAESLTLALSRLDLPYAIQLLNAGAPTCNVSLDAKVDTSSDAVKLFATKRAEFCIAYYEQKLVPFFEDMSSPIFSGRAEMDVFTAFWNFSFFRAWIDAGARRDGDGASPYEEGIFTTSEERKARDFMRCLEHTMQVLLVEYKNIKTALASKDTSKILTATNQFKNKLWDMGYADQIYFYGVFSKRFLELIPTKRAYERYLLLLTNSKTNSSSRFGDHRDGFSCLDSKFDPSEDAQKYASTFPKNRNQRIQWLGWNHKWHTDYESGLEAFETIEMQQKPKTVQAVADQKAMKKS